MKLTIFGGITGFNKSDFIRSFTSKCLEKHGLSTDLACDESRDFIHYIKFEQVLLDVTESMDLSHFLAKPSLHVKNHDIERTFRRVASIIEDSNAEHVFLDIHFSCLYQSQFFSPIHAANLNELAPHSDTEIRVVTLIDDVYQIWNNLKKREDEFPNTSLRLREILSWRSVEYLFGETVALNYTDEDRRASNVVFAVRHPFISLYNLLFIDNPVCVYLSFPITRTRSVPERVDDINKFRKKMYEIAEEYNIVVFDPVTIDELALRNAPLHEGARVLKAAHRWPLETEILVNKPEWPIIIPNNEVQEAELDIMNQIKPRDYKLIDSSIITTVYRRNFGGPSTGVNEEIRYAIGRGKGVFVYDPLEDSDAEEPHPFDPDINGSREIEDYYSNIIKGIEYYKARST